MSAVYMSAVYLPLLISAATLLICIVSFLYLKSHLKRKTNLQYLRNEVLSEIREEVNMILRAIDEATERDISLIKERENELKSTLEEIDRRLKVYIREIESQKKADEIYAQAAAAVPAEQAPPAPQNDGTYLELGKQRYKPAPAAFPLPDFSVKEKEGPSTTAEKIRELLQMGFPAQAIASRLGISIAEAEFAAALYERALNEQALNEQALIK